MGGYADLLVKPGHRVLEERAVDLDDVEGHGLIAGGRNPVAELAVDGRGRAVANTAHVVVELEHREPEELGE